MSSVELYFLIEKREKAIINKFMNCYIPRKKELAKEYSFPEGADNPTIIYTNVNDLIDNMIEKKKDTYTIYWDNLEKKSPNTIILSFIIENSMVFGIVVPENESLYWLKKIKNDFQVKYGYLTGDEPPPETVKEFKDICQNASNLRIFNDEIFPPIRTQF